MERIFEESDLTKTILDALDNAGGHLMSHGLSQDPMIDKWDKLMKHIKDNNLDVRLVSRVD